MIKLFQELERMITFKSVHHSIKAEQILLAKEYIVEAIPTPRQVDVSCGQSLLFYAKDEAKIMAIINNENILWGKLFKRDRINNIYEKLQENGE